MAACDEYTNREGSQDMSYEGGSGMTVNRQSERTDYELLQNGAAVASSSLLKDTNNNLTDYYRSNQ